MHENAKCFFSSLSLNHSIGRQNLAWAIDRYGDGEKVPPDLSWRSVG